MAPFLPFDGGDADEDCVDEGEEAPPVVEPVEPVELVVLLVPLPDALAAAWNASKVLFAVGLTANTMPDWQ
jgi:hypothetical protein